ncbi:hypothetical protein CLU79DRAFT_683918, partial [Phycomyces nitens]
IDILLNQEKVYDRTHPQYLYHILLQYSFLLLFITYIIPLFFTACICFNDNGYIYISVFQSQDLHKVDTLSPVFFNFVFEHVLFHILNNPLFQEY